MVRVVNEGPGDAAAGLVVAVEDAAVGTTLETVVVESPIPSGQSTEGLVFDLLLEDVPSGTLRFTADPFDGQRECNEDDNTLVVYEGLCDRGLFHFLLSASGLRSWGLVRLVDEGRARFGR